MSANGKSPSSELDMLIKLMGQTQSDNDNIVLVAARAANRWLTQKGKNWDDLLRGKVHVEADPFGGAPVVAPGTRPTRTYTPQYPPNAPPPPPRQFDDKKELQGYFDKLEFRNLPQYMNDRINKIRDSWMKQGFLLYGDYDFLRSTANSKKRY